MMIPPCGLIDLRGLSMCTYVLASEFYTAAFSAVSPGLWCVDCAREAGEAGLY